MEMSGDFFQKPIIPTPGAKLALSINLFRIITRYLVILELSGACIIKQLPTLRINLFGLLVVAS
jgi:hypothetical protein